MMETQSELKTEIKGRTIDLENRQESRYKSLKV